MVALPDVLAAAGSDRRMDDRVDDDLLTVAIEEEALDAYSAP